MAPRSLFQFLKSTSQRLFPKKRKKAIEDWDFILVFNLSFKKQIKFYFQDLKCKPSVKFQFIEHTDDGKLLVLIAIDQSLTIEQAHELKILKIKNKKSFELSLKEIYNRIDQAESENSQHYADYLRFIAARFEPDNKRIAEQERYSVFNKHKVDKYPPNEKGELFSPEEELRCKYNFLLTYRQTIAHQKAIQDAFRFPFVDIMKHQSFQQIIPIHKNSRFNPLIFDSVKDYVGSNDEVYFEFVSFLQKWLVFPAIIGLGIIRNLTQQICDMMSQKISINQKCAPSLIRNSSQSMVDSLVTTFFNYFFEYSADDSPGDFVYSLLIMVWSIYFITSWENESKWLKTKEASGYNDQVWSEHQNLIQKNGLSKRISKVTGKWELYLPLKEKLQYYFISIGTCVLISAASIFFMILSLNARGFVDPNHKLLYFETLSSWAAKGGIFDAQTWWGQVPNLIHVIVTNVFDESVYRPLAKKLTKIERHLNSKTHSNSIIMKFFIYEFIITFADFFYIAFVRFDIEGLRQQLLSLFFIDVVRRLVAETIIPRFKNKYISYSLRSSVKSSMAKNKSGNENSNNDASGNGNENKSLNGNENNCNEKEKEELRHYAILEVNKEHFQSFDDYLEIITNFGYLVMISSCFPLAPLLIILAHSVEILQDKYKLIHIYRRRLPQKFVGMGNWKGIIVFICYMSIVTNILLFAFSSQQIVSIFPQIFESGKDLVLGNTDFTTLLGGAATGVLSAVIDIGGNTVQTVSNTLNVFDSNFTSPQTNIYVQNNGWGDYFQNDTASNDSWIDPLTIEGSMIPSTHTFKPVPKEHEVEFIAILFLLQHIFLIGFILLRDIISKRKSITEIFLERRAYKRRIKKYLSKDILAQNIRDEVVSKLIQPSLGHQNPLGMLGKLLQSTSTTITEESMPKETEMIKKGSNESADFFSSMIEKLATSAEHMIAGQSVNPLPPVEKSLNEEPPKKEN